MVTQNTDNVDGFHLEDIEALINKESPIGEGRYRQVYRLGNKALKVMKPFRTKKYWFFSIDFPTRPYTRLKYGIDDLNLFELKLYRKIVEKVPSAIADSFSHITDVTLVDGRSISISELVTDSDGSVSQTMQQHGPINDEDFWYRMERLENFMRFYKIFFGDLVDHNIAVQKRERTLPVIVDYKRASTKLYPFQPWLAFESQQTSSVQRKFARLREQYQV